MNCPNCQHGMDEGVIVGRSPGVKFKAAKGLLGDLTGKTITSGVFNHQADAFRCDECGTVVVAGAK